MELIYFAELDLPQLFNTATDPLESMNLLQEEASLAAELERDLFGYLEKGERKTSRPLFSRMSAGHRLLASFFVIFFNPTAFLDQLSKTLKERILLCGLFLLECLAFSFYAVLVWQQKNRS
ncbi:MAG: hypothetical protein MUO52_11990 [Desulfobacterales bacterium]|nr:hypothetical protein [Desulfobacterales bacterium]